MSTVKIEFVGHEEHQSEPHRLHPCVSVYVLPPGSDDGTSHGFKVWATIDTGADYLYISPELAAELDLPVVGKTDVNGDQDQPIYFGRLGIVGIEGTSDVRLVQRESRSVGLPFDVVLGRVLLNRLALEYSPSGDGCFLRMLDQRPGSVGAS